MSAVFAQKMSLGPEPHTLQEQGDWLEEAQGDSSDLNGPFLSSARAGRLVGWESKS